ncbi:MAG: hypothetical protein HZA94_00855 [Candidatus Vogelbacteria bacterium]|nr:hypothetical protein [Candidatus Vogelbacteria bacterium]
MRSRPLQICLGVLCILSLFVPTSSFVVTACLGFFFALSTGWIGFVVKPLEELPLKTGRLDCPAHDGKVLSRPTDLLQVAALRLTLTHYMEQIAELERDLGLNPGQRVFLESPDGEDLLGLNYRVAILRFLLRDGSVDTGRLYSRVKVSLPFSHDQFTRSVRGVETDIATAGVDCVLCD